MLATRRVDVCWCVVMGDADVTDAEWRAWLAELENDPTSPLRVLAYISSFGPNAMQRAQLYRLAETRQVQIAALVGSDFARGVVKALAWSGKIVIRAYAGRGIEGALNYLNLQSPERASALHTLRALMADLSVGPVTH